MNHDPLDTCPYDPVHRIIRSRMQFHLTKCSKNHPSAKKMCCPYDARHIVDEVAYKYHVDTCPAGESVWHYHISDQPPEEQSKTLPIEPFNAQSTESWEEDWDKDCHVKSYNALQNIQDREVTHMVIGLSKAKRKAHRLEERRRFAELVNQKERSEKAKQQADANAKNKHVGNGTERKKTGQANANDQGEQEYKPLRRPRKQPQDILNASRASAIDTSIASLHQESSLQNTSPPIDSVTSPKDVPLSYSAALNRKSKNNKSNGNTSNTQKSTQEGEKENVTNNTSLHNNTADSSVIEKLSSTLNEIAVGDEGHKKKSEKLNKEIDMAKKMNLSKNSASNEISSNKFKKLPRCAANFSSLK